MESNKLYQAEMKVWRSRKSCQTPEQRESHKRFKALYLTRVKETEGEARIKYLTDLVWCLLAALGLVLIIVALVMIGVINADAIDAFFSSVVKSLLSR